VRPRFEEDLERLSGRHEFVAGSQNETRLDSLVAATLDISRTRAATLVSNGAVTVNGKREKSSFRATPGDKVVVDVPEVERRVVGAEDIPIEIVFEDDCLVVVNKAAGMVVHPAPGNWTGTLVNALKGRVDRLSKSGGEERAGLVHRLDKDTSGLLMVAKTERVHRLLSAAIAARRVSRRYVAMMWGHLKTDEIFVDKPIGRDPRDRKRMAIVANGRESRTDFFRIARFDSADLLRAHLRSGRTHQIRVHLASIGHPVVGDDIYGGGGGRRLASLPTRRHFLHAAWLIFHHPLSGEQMDLRAPLPSDLRQSLLVMSGMLPEQGGAAESGESATLSSNTPDLLDHFGFFRTPG
jgi:23S rRNA pseudouridine1911/1915/1917 synthase